MEDITPLAWRRLEAPNDLPEKRHHSLSLVGTTLVVYGGCVDGQPVGDLLVLKNWKTGWEKKTWGGTVSPPPLSFHTAVEFGLRLYLLGGRTTSGLNGDVFVYNQVTSVWNKARQLGDALPPTRYAHASAALGRLIYVFGGCAAESGSFFGDFWSYNTDTNFWASVSTEKGPSARRGHTMTLCRNVLYVFGGTTSAGLSNETFSWNSQSNAWQRHVTAGHVPPATTGHAAFAVGRHIYILGGETAEGPQRDVYALDTENFAWQRISQLSNVCCARRGHATCYNSNEHVVFVTGGGTDALGFTQPSFDTFARRIEVNIGPSFIPAPEDPAITRAPTQAAMTKPKLAPDLPASLPGAATITHRPVAPVSATTTIPRTATLTTNVSSPARSGGSTGSTDLRTSTPGERQPSPMPRTTQDSDKRASTTGRKTGSKIARQLPDSVDVQPALAARTSTTPSTTNPPPSPGFFGSLKKKLNPGPLPAIDEKAAADDADDASNQDDNSVSKDSGSHIQDDRSGGNTTKDATDQLSPETKQLLAELEAEAIIRALLPLSKDYWMTKKLRTYHHVFCGSEAVTWLEKNLLVPRAAGVIYFQRLMDEGWFAHVPNERPFQDGSSHHYQLTEKALSLRPAVTVDEDKKKADDNKKESRSDLTSKDHKDKGKDDDEAKRRKEEEADKRRKEDDEEKKRKEEERRKRREKKEKPAAPEPEISITGPTAMIYSSKEAASVPATVPKPTPKQKTEEEVVETADLIAKKDAHRQEVLKELIATEKDYIRDLGIIVNLYMEPLQNEHKALIKPNEFQSVFSTINMLPPLNQELVGKLEKTKELPPGDQIVGGVFLEMHPYFKLYMGYCTNHAASLSTLKKLKNNGAFAAFIEEVRQKPECRKLDIEAYLIKPLQRICRYPLLLKEIYKDMPRKHKDRPALADAIEKIEQVVREVNEAKRLAEHLNQVVEIQNSFVFPDATTEIVTSSRRLVREAQVQKVTNGLLSAASYRIFFLFNDLLLIGTEKLGKNIGIGKKYSFKAMHPIETIIVWDVKDGDGGKHIKNAFTIVRTDKKDKQTYMVTTKEDKDQLVAAINECIINIPNLGKDKKDTREVREAAFAAFKKTLA